MELELELKMKKKKGLQVIRKSWCQHLSSSVIKY